MAVELRVRRAFRRMVYPLRRLQWMLHGRPRIDPWNFGKRDRLREVAQRHGCRTFVETGTYFGESVVALRPYFERLITIELAPALAALARDTFRGDAAVVPLEGDSAEVLGGLESRIVGRALVWLDGHFSGGFTAGTADVCPLEAELLSLGTYARRDHVILIDDIRLLGTDPSYPTPERTRELLLAINPAYTIVAEHDVMSALPPA